MLLSWAPFHLMGGVAPSGGSRFSFLQLMFVYLTARVARTLDVKVRLRHVLGCVMLYVLMVLLLGGGCVLLKMLTGRPSNAYDITFYTCYDAPHVYLMATILVMVFAQKVRIPSCLS